MRKKLEKAIKTLNLNSDISFDMQYWEDADGNMIHVSPSCERITGYKAKEFINNSVLANSIIFAEDVPIWKRHRELAKNGESHEVQFRIINKNGSIVWIEHVCQKIFDEEEVFQGFRGSNRDITTRKLTADIHKTSPTTLFLWENKEGWPVTFVTENIEKLSGYSMKEFLANKIAYADIVYPEDIERVAEEVEEFSNQKTEEFEHKPYRIVTKSGKIKWVDDKTNIKRDVNGKITHYQGSVTDVTTKIDAELKLKESQNRYEQIAEGIEAILWEYDIREDRWTYVSPQTEKMLGYLPEEWTNLKFWKDHIHEDDRGWASKYCEDCTSRGESHKFEYRFIKKNGDVIWLRDVVNVVLENEIPVIMRGYMSNISNIKEASEELRNTKNKYQDLFEKSKDPVLIIQNGKFVDCNQATIEMLRYKEKADLLKTHPSELSPQKQPDGSDSFKKADEMIAIAIEKGSNRFEWNHIRATGEVFPAEVLLTSISNEDGSSLIHVVWRDITERKKRERLQKALYDISEEASNADSTNDFYHALHEIIKTLMPAKNFYIAIHDTDDNTISFPYHLDEYDESPKTLPFGRGLTEYVLTTKQSQIITETKDKELQKNKDVELSGEYTKIWVGIYLEFESKFNGVLVLQDYTNENAYDDEDVKVLQFVSEQIKKTLDKTYADVKLRKYVKELFEAKEELELINKNKDRFFSIISHDLRSPFMTLMGISQMISEDMDSMSVGEMKEMTGTIYNSTHSLYKLIENLLNWSRLQMGGFEISPKEINLKEISENVVSLLSLSATEKGISIEDKVLETSIFADEDCAKTILRNLVNNAIKFTKRGGKIDVSAKIKNKFIEISVEDNGVGMPETTLKKLFIITEKVSEVGTEKEVGTGLGLVLCKELVEKNNGKIWVESELGKGSKFTFTLPKNAKI